MKRISCVILALLLALGLLGCNPTTEYTCLELTMTVPDKMTDVSAAEENLGFNFALENDTMFICGIRQDFYDLLNGPSLSLHDYTEQLIETYQLEDSYHAEREGKDYFFLRFQVPLEDGVHQYLCGVYRSNSAFWLIQMDAKTADFEEEQFFEYLDSVKFS